MLTFDKYAIIPYPLTNHKNEYTGDIMKTITIDLFNKDLCDKAIQELKESKEPVELILLFAPQIITKYIGNKVAGVFIAKGQKLPLSIEEICSLIKNKNIYTLSLQGPWPEIINDPEDFIDIFDTITYAPIKKFELSFDMQGYNSKTLSNEYFGYFLMTLKQMVFLKSLSLGKTVFNSDNDSEFLEFLKDSNIESFNFHSIYVNRNRKLWRSGIESCKNLYNIITIDAPMDNWIRQIITYPQKALKKLALKNATQPQIFYIIEYLSTPYKIKYNSDSYETTYNKNYHNLEKPCFQIINWNITLLDDMELEQLSKLLLAYIPLLKNSGEKYHQIFKIIYQTQPEIFQNHIEDKLLSKIRHGYQEDYLDNLKFCLKIFHFSCSFEDKKLLELLKNINKEVDLKNMPQHLDTLIKYCNSTIKNGEKQKNTFINKINIISNPVDLKPYHLFLRFAEEAKNAKNPPAPKYNLFNLNFDANINYLDNNKKVEDIIKFKNI